MVLDGFSRVHNVLGPAYLSRAPSGWTEATWVALSKKSQEAPQRPSIKCEQLADATRREVVDVAAARSVAVVQEPLLELVVSGVILTLAMP